MGAYYKEYGLRICCYCVKVIFALTAQLFQYKDKINDISTQASNEATLEIMLNKVRKVLVVFSDMGGEGVTGRKTRSMISQLRVAARLL